MQRSPRRTSRRCVAGGSRSSDLGRHTVICRLTRGRQAARIGAALCTTLLLSHCATSRPLETPPPAARLLERIAADRQRAGPLVATFSARISRGRAWFASRSVTGVLAVHPPDRFRVRLFMPGGLTVHDLAVVGDRYRLILPLEAREERGTVRSIAEADCAETRPGLALAWLFAHDSTRRAATGITIRDGDRYVVVSDIDASAQLRLRVTISRQDHRVLSEELRRGDDGCIRVEYGDHRPLGEVYLPHRIRFTNVRGGVGIALDIHRYRSKERLADEVFGLPWDS